MGLQIILPPNLASVKYRCLVPTGRGDETCGKPFFEGEERAWQRHVVQCAKDHEEAVRTATIPAKMPGLFGAEAGDVEFERWVQRNARAIIEGRRRM